MNAAALANSSTFVPNMRLPVHGWFRYSAGFSAAWAREVIEEAKEASGAEHVLDPFSGSGTVALVAERCGIEGIGLEAHPFVGRIAETKLCWRADPTALREHAALVLARSLTEKPDTSAYPALIQKCFPPATLASLDQLRRSHEALDDGSDVARLSWLAIVAILRACSPVGTAQWQYVLPNKNKARSADPFEAFATTTAAMSRDMRERQAFPPGPPARLLVGDARTCGEIPDDWADLVITSPPYANNYDYADATRLEMSFFGQVRGWGDLHDTVRQHLIRSCSQHAGRLRDEVVENLIESERIRPIRDDLRAVYERLRVERESHGGKKAYHNMIVAYFADLADVWFSLRRVTRRGGIANFVIGDSAPYGIYVPVEQWLARLALEAGFCSYDFVKLRDRNTKWRNRKHTVPLHEGILRVTA